MSTTLRVRFYGETKDTEHEGFTSALRSLAASVMSYGPDYGITVDRVQMAENVTTGSITRYGRELDSWQIF